MQIKSDLIHSSWQLEPIRLAGTLLCSPFYPWVCQINDSFKTPLHCISLFSQHTLYIPWKINHIMKIWINLNKWLHIICLTLKTMTTVYIRAANYCQQWWETELLKRAITAAIPPKSPTEDPDEAACHSCALACNACTSRIRKMTDFPNCVCDTAPSGGLTHWAGSIRRLLSGFAGRCDIVREG